MNAAVELCNIGSKHAWVNSKLSPVPLDQVTASLSLDEFNNDRVGISNAPH